MIELNVLQTLEQEAGQTRPQLFKALISHILQIWNLWKELIYGQICSFIFIFACLCDIWAKSSLSCHAGRQHITARGFAGLIFKQLKSSARSMSVYLKSHPRWGEENGLWAGKKLLSVHLFSGWRQMARSGPVRGMRMWILAVCSRTNAHRFFQWRQREMSDCLHVWGRFLRTTGCCAEEEVVFCVMYCTTQSSYCTGGHMERILRTIQTEVTQLGIITTCALTARFKFCAWHILHLAPAHLSSVIKNGILVNTSSDGSDAG